jgi:hypothetical protein
MRPGRFDPYAIVLRRGDAGGRFERGRPGCAAKLDSSFSSQPG